MLTTLLSLIATGTAVGAIASECKSWRGGFVLCKPLPLVALLVLAGSHGGGEAYGAWLTAGLALSLIGDVFLLDKENGFIKGLTFFLLAHIAYASAFATRFEAWPGTIGIALPMLGLAYFALLRSRLKASLRLPVLAYTLAITTMLILAYAQDDSQAACLSLLGAGLFALSDGLLSWNRFVSPLRHAQVWVLGSYYPAQLLLTWSLLV
ncbi:MAG: lysoplasmalogenase [Gammaproteobacteria bacterium]|nr:lysoplasmalogenase [Gammaproteobacteria bacterium]